MPDALEQTQDAAPLVVRGVGILGSIAVGYHSGVAGASRSPVMLSVAIAFSAVIMVIADLDRPGQGFIKVSQEPMVDLRAALAGSKP